MQTCIILSLGIGGLHCIVKAFDVFSKVDWVKIIIDDRFTLSQCPWYSI